MYRADAPFRRDTITPEACYKDGFETGIVWESNYRPGGPFVPRAERGERDIDWIAYCERKALCNKEYLRGFDAGILARNA